VVTFCAPSVVRWTLWGRGGGGRCLRSGGDLAGPAFSGGDCSAAGGAMPRHTACPFAERELAAAVFPYASPLLVTAIFGFMCDDARHNLLDRSAVL